MDHNNSILIEFYVISVYAFQISLTIQYNNHDALLVENASSHVETKTPES